MRRALDFAIVLTMLAGCARQLGDCPGGFVTATASLDVCLTYPPVPDDFACPPDYPLRAETCERCCAACTAVVADPTQLSSIVAGACPPPPADAGSD